MWILYLDESGVPEPHPGQTSHYVQLGLAIHEGTWFALQRQVAGLKRRFALVDPNEFELHAAVLLRYYPEQRQVPRFEDLSRTARHQVVMQRRDALERHVLPGLPGKKRQRTRRYHHETAPYVHLTHSERSELIEGALRIVAHYRRGLYLFGEAISKPHLSAGIDPVQEAFTQIVRRFEHFLRRRRQKTWGMLVVDYDEHKALRFANLLRQFQERGSGQTDVQQVIEAPFFLDSYLNSGVQVADVCAYALRRYLENGEDARFLPILPKFYQTSTRLLGLRHFIPEGECTCEICRLRGRTRR